MLSADVASLEKIHFSTFHSSMSAVVQELYTSLPAALSTELTALSDPTVALGAKPGTSTFVLSCSSLPFEHQRTHGLKICPQDSVEKLDCTGKASCPELMDLLSEDPSGTGGFVENYEIQNRSIMELDYHQVCLSKDARMAKDMGDIAKEGLVQCPLTSKETCWSKEALGARSVLAYRKLPFQREPHRDRTRQQTQVPNPDPNILSNTITGFSNAFHNKESQLIQEGREFFSSSPCIETAGWLQSLEEDQAKVQVTPENLSNPMKEAPGMKADGARLFSKAGEPSARVSTGVPPQSSKCSDVDTVMAKVAVSGTDTLVSLEPVTPMDNVSTKEQLQEEEEEEGGGGGKGLAACVTLSAVRDALSSSDAGGEKFPNQDEGVNATLDNYPPALQGKMSLHENNSSALVLESRITVDIQASNTSSETSGLLFEGSLEFGNALWEQNTDLIEAVCEMPEGGCCSVTREESLKSNPGGQIEALVEEQASEQHVGETPSQTWSGEELPSGSDSEQEMDGCHDHSYSRAYERALEIQKGAAVQWRWKAIREKPQSENGTFSIPTEQFAVAKTMRPENGIRPLPPSPEGHLEDGFRPGSSGTDNTPKDQPQCAFPNDGRLATKENGGPLEEANNFECFQNSCSVNVNSHPTCHDALCADTELGDESSVQMESNSDPRAEIPKIVSAVTHLHATNSSKLVDVNLATDEEHPQTTQLCNELLFTQQADLTLGSSLCLDILHRELLPGTCAELERESFLPHHKKVLASREQSSGSRATTSEESQNRIAFTLKDAEKRTPGLETVRSAACTPRDDLRSAVETCCAISGSISDDDPKVRTETTTEESDGLEMHHPSVFDREALHPQKCGSGKVWDCHPCGNNWSGLDGAESMSRTGLPEAETLESDAEAECQRADGDNNSVNSEDVPDANASVYPPSANLGQELTEASLVVESDGMETVESVKIYGDSQRTGLGKKLICDRGLEQTCPLEKVGTLVKDQSKKEQERHQVHPCHPSSSSSSSSAPELSSLKKDLTSGSPGHAEQQGCSLLLCSKDPGQPRETICQNKMQSIVYQNDFNGLILLNQKTEVPEIDVTERQQPPLMLSERQEADRTVVTHSAEEVRSTDKCNQNRLPFPGRGPDPTPPAPVLVIENGVQETLPRNLVGDGAFNKIVSELINSPFKEETIELKAPKPRLRSSERAPKLLKLNGFIKDQAQETKNDEFHSASEAGNRNPSDVQDENPCLKFNSKPASTPSPAFFQPDTVTFTTSNGQTSAGGEYSKSFENKDMPCLTCTCLAGHPVQNPGSWISQKYEPPLKVLWSPLAKGHPAGTTPLERGAGPPINQLALKNEKVNCPAGAGAHVDSPLENKEISVSTGGSKQGAGRVREVRPAIFNRPDSSKKMKLSLEEDDQRERGLTEETVALPVPSLSLPKNSSAALLQALKFAVAGKEIAFPFNVEIHIRPSLVHLTAHTSELGLSKAKGPSKAAVVKWHSRNRRNTLRAQYSTPTRWSLETLWNTMSCAYLGGRLLEGFPRCLHSKRRCWMGIESKQELAGDKRQPSQGQLANLSIVAPIEKVRASAAGSCLVRARKPGQEGAEPSAALSVAACAAVRQEDQAEEKRRAKSLSKWRRRAVERPPVGSSSQETVGKRVVLAGQTLMEGSVIEYCGNRSTCSTFWEPKRPPKAKDLIGAGYLEAGTPSLCFRHCSWQSAADREKPTTAFCTLPRAVSCSPDGSQGACGMARNMRGPLPLRRQPGKGCRGTAPVAAQFMVARKGHLMPSSTAPKNPSEIAARHRFELLDSVSLPTRPAAWSSHGTVASWAQTPKQSGSRSPLLNSSKLRSRAKEPAVLFRRLSALADSLLAPPRDPEAFKPRLHSTQLLPVAATHSQLRIKKLLEIASCVKMKFSSAWINGGRCCCFEVFRSQPAALYPKESASLCFFELSSRTPLAFSAPIFPVSFHAKADSQPGRTLSGATPLHSVPSRLPLGEAHAVQPPKWTFSFLLPQNEAWIPAEPCSASAESLSAAKERGREAAVPSCPMLGLQTALALFSPGCYRVWTRKRHLGSRLLAAQKQTPLQFPRAVKGLKCPTPVSANLFPSLPSSLGRGPSPWSQHGLPTCPSAFTPLHSHRCKWQPSSRQSLRNRTFIAESSALLSLVRDPCMEASKALDDAMRLKLSFSAPLPTSCSVPEPAPSPPLGFPGPKFQVHPLDELDVSVPAVLKTGTPLEKAELEKRPKKVSQIRIRKTIPKPDPNLTPMGLPRPKRVKKTEFSLEEIYTNKNYKSPPTTRCLETIFEEPKEKNGSLISVSQQKRKRILEFQDFTIPRKRKARSRVKVMGSFTRAQKAALEGRELDVLLIQKLTDLEMFFAKEEQEQASGS